MAMETGEPEILAPHARLGGAGGLFRDENLDLLSRALDTWFRIPGTQIRFGLDGIIGFVPGIGDVLAGLASCIIVLAAYFRGVALVTIARMVANLGIEVLVGTIPLLGNIFDIAWRANRRNYHLLERSLIAGQRDTWQDWLFMLLLGAGLMTLALVPFVLLTWISMGILRSLGLTVQGW
jgi:hypothetical protein